MANIGNRLVKLNTVLTKIALLTIVAAYSMVIELACFGVLSVYSQPLQTGSCTSLRVCWSIKNTVQNECISDGKHPGDRLPARVVPIGIKQNIQFVCTCDSKTDNKTTLEWTVGIFNTITPSNRIKTTAQPGKTVLQINGTELEHANKYTCIVKANKDVRKCVILEVSNSTVSTPFNSGIIWASGLGLLLLVLLLLAISLILMWKYDCWIHRKKNNVLIEPVKKDLLEAEYYKTNSYYIPARNSLDENIPMVPIIMRSAITDLHKIGEGFFGTVYKGLLHTMDNNKAEKVEPVAVKMLKHKTTEETEEEFMREVEIMSSFKHTNILSLIGLCPRDYSSSPWMVFEFMQFGDLASLLRSTGLQTLSSAPSPPSLSQESLLSISAQISEGMKYLAEQRFVHRDLACRNCLVGFNLVVKIADFGMSRDVYTCDYYKMGESRILPVRWMPPESIVFGRFTQQSDVWSYGVVLWEIYTYGQQPYYGYSNEQVLKFIKNGILLGKPEDCPEEVYNIMKACWGTDAQKRIMFSEICARLSELKERMSKPNISALPRPPPSMISIDYLALLPDKTADDDTDDEKAEILLDQDHSLPTIERLENVLL